MGDTALSPNFVQPWSPPITGRLPANIAGCKCLSSGCNKGMVYQYREKTVNGVFAKYKGKTMCDYRIVSGACADPDCKARIARIADIAGIVKTIQDVIDDNISYPNATEHTEAVSLAASKAKSVVHSIVQHNYNIKMIEDGSKDTIADVMLMAASKELKKSANSPMMKRALQKTGKLARLAGDVERETKKLNNIIKKSKLSTKDQRARTALKEERRRRRAARREEERNAAASDDDSTIFTSDSDSGLYATENTGAGRGGGRGGRRRVVDDDSATSRALVAADGVAGMTIDG